MSVSTTTDPVATVKDILENTTDSDWSNAGSKPRRIQYQSETTMQAKHNYSSRRGDALYLWSPTEGNISAFAASKYNSYLDEQFVNIDAWTVESRSHIANLAGDIRSIIQGYATDNKASTKWNRIRPVSENDVRHEADPNTKDVYRIITLVELNAVRST